MPPPENAFVKQQRQWLRDLYAQSISEGVEGYSDMPDWVSEFIRTHGVRKRGYLLGVLLEEWGRMEDAG